MISSITSGNDTSEESRAQLQKWQNELADIDSEIEENAYSQYISDQKDILNSVYENYETFLDEKAEDTERLFQEAMAQAKNNTSAMKDTVETAAGAVGYDIDAGIDDLLSDGSTLNTNLNQVEARLLANGLSIIDGVEQIDATNNGIVTNTANLVNNTTGLNQWISDVKDAISGNGGIGDKIDAAKDAIVGALGSLSSSKESNANHTSTGSFDNANDFSNINAIPAIGDTFNGVTGKWYSASDGGKSGSVTTLGADTWMISKIAEGAEYPYHLIGYKNGKFAGSGWVKKLPEYAGGLSRAMKDHLAWTQDGGSEAIVRPSDGAILTPLKVGDSVLTSDATKNLINMMTNPASFIAQNMSLMTPDMSAIGMANGGTVENNIAITIPLENVTDVQSFLLEFQRNPKIQAVIKDMIAESTLGTSSLAKYRHKI